MISSKHRRKEILNGIVYISSKGECRGKKEWPMQSLLNADSCAINKKMKKKKKKTMEVQDRRKTKSLILRRQLQEHCPAAMQPPPICPHTALASPT